VENAINAVDYTNQNARDEIAADLYLNDLDISIARRSFVDYCAYVVPDWETKPHHVAIGKLVDRMTFGDLKFAIVNMQPRVGKSEMTSKQMPPFFLAHHPLARVVNLSYAMNLSTEFSFLSRQVIRDNERYKRLFPHMALDPLSQRLDFYRTLQGGSVRSLGVGSGFSGRGADLIIADDVVKEGDEQSRAVLEATWTYFISAVRTRLEKGGRIFIMMTRWHPSDLVGRILEAMKDLAADQYETLILPAFAEENDPIGREVGEVLWPEKYDADYLNSIRLLSERYFEALYQQNPSVSSDPMFSEDDFFRFDSPISDGVWTFDFAASEKERSDYNVFARWELKDDTLICGFVERWRGDWHKAKARVLELMDEFPDDKFAFPKQLHELLALREIRSLRPQLVGKLVEVSMPGDKVSRALVFSDWVRSGRVVICDGEQGDHFVWEHANFPDVADHDDCVDVSSVVTHFYGLTTLFDMVMSSETDDEIPRINTAQEVFERLSR